jgi:hypothetical protein
MEFFDMCRRKLKAEGYTLGYRHFVRLLKKMELDEYFPPMRKRRRRRKQVTISRGGTCQTFSKDGPNSGSPKNGFSPSVAETLLEPLSGNDDKRRCAKS